MNAPSKMISTHSALRVDKSTIMDYFVGKTCRIGANVANKAKRPDFDIQSIAWENPHLSMTNVISPINY